MASMTKLGVRCPVCECSLVVGFFSYMCMNHGPIHTDSFEPEAVPFSIAHFHNPHSADPEGISQQLQMRPAPAVTPVSDFQPMQHDPWPWFDDDSWHQAVQQNNQRQRNFVIATNGAHRQAMNELKASAS
jgi:hypothetical protein